jgi:hypothetical protein
MVRIRMQYYPAAMDAESLALDLLRMHAWMERSALHPGSTCRPVCGAANAAQICIDPTSTEAAASFNRNRILLCGRSGGLSHADLLRSVETFRSHGVRRVFAWLSPGPERDTVRGWLASLRMQRVVWTRYPTLTLIEPARVSPGSGFEIREAARRLGCTTIVSQTLTLLERSLANLRRCGFREVYEQEVYEGHV